MLELGRDDWRNGSPSRVDLDDKNPRYLVLLDADHPTEDLNYLRKDSIGTLEYSHTDERFRSGQPSSATLEAYSKMSYTLICSILVIYDLCTVED